MSLFRVSVISVACSTLVLSLGTTIARAQTIPVNFDIDDALSEFRLDVTIDTSVGSDSDRNSSTISGTSVANLTIDPSGGTPLITALDFLGPVEDNRFVIDEDLEYDFRFLLFFTINATGSNLAGYTGTPDPPAPVTPLGPGDLNYEFDSAQYEYTLNEGTLAYSGNIGDIANGEFNLAETPFGGSPPDGTMGSIELTQGATHG